MTALPPDAALRIASFCWPPKYEWSAEDGGIAYRDRAEACGACGHRESQEPGWFNESEIDHVHAAESALASSEPSKEQPEAQVAPAAPTVVREPPPETRDLNDGTPPAAFSRAELEEAARNAVSAWVQDTNDERSELQVVIDAVLAERQAEPVNELRLCEASRLVLRPFELYRFTIDPKCPLCVGAVPGRPVDRDADDDVRVPPGNWTPEIVAVAKLRAPSAAPQEPDDEERPYPCGAMRISDKDAFCAKESDHDGEHEWVQGRHAAAPQEPTPEWIKELQRVAPISSPSVVPPPVAAEPARADVFEDVAASIVEKVAPYMENKRAAAKIAAVLRDQFGPSRLSARAEETKEAK